MTSIFCLPTLASKYISYCIAKPSPFELMFLSACSHHNILLTCLFNQSKNSIRSNCIEYFTASTDEHGRGRQTPVSEGRVGIRCVFCKDEPKHEQASQACTFILYFLSTVLYCLFDYFINICYCILHIAIHFFDIVFAYDNYIYACPL